MAEPLNYWSPNNGGDEPRPKDRGQQAVPPHFDRILTETTDHPAVRFIQDRLKKLGVEVFVTDDRKPANRGFRLHVRSADYEKAATAAAEVFARRAKVKSFPAVEPSPDFYPRNERPDTF